MGYYMELVEASFYIKKADVPKALAAVKNLATQTHRGSGGTYANGKHTSHFAWVTTEELANAPTLDKAIEAWGWEIGYDKGNVYSITFERNKIGDEEVLFETLAPFVRDGSFIHMNGEDGNQWRWYFRNGKLEEQSMVPDWDGECAEVLGTILKTFKTNKNLPVLIGIHPKLDERVDKLIRSKK